MTLDQLPPRYREQALRQLGLPVSGKGHFALVPPSSSVRESSASVSTHTEASTKPLRKIGKSSLIKAPSPDEATKTVRKTRPTLTPDQADSIVKSVSVSPDGNEVKFILSVNPQALPTAQQKGVFVGKDGRAHFFTKAKVAKSERALTKALAPYAHLTRRWGDEVAIAVSVVFCFPYPTGTPKKKLVQYGYHTSRSDVDNLFKGFGDSLTEAGFWKDDSLIADLHLKKFRVIDSPRIGLCITNLTNKQMELFDSQSNTTTPPATTTPSETNPLADLKTTTHSDSPQEADNYKKTTQQLLNTTGISETNTTKGTL